MDKKNITSYAELDYEYDLPFYMRSTGYFSSNIQVSYPNGYLKHYICIILEGEVHLKAGTYSFSLSENDGFFMRSNFPFEYHSVSKKCRVHWITFDGYATIPLFSKLGMQNYIFFHNLDTDSLSYDLSQMYYNSINADDTSKLINSAMTYKFLIDIYSQATLGNNTTSYEHSSNAFLFAKNYIDQFYMNPLTQVQIADASKISPQHLCRLFKKNMHMTPTYYLNSVRIEQAKILLRKTSLSIVQIGERTGFVTPHYFSSTFKKMTNKTASEYRQLARIAANEGLKKTTKNNIQ